MRSNQCSSCKRHRDNLHVTSASKCAKCLAEATAAWRLRTGRTKSRVRGRRPK